MHRMGGCRTSTFRRRKRSTWPPTLPFPEARHSRLPAPMSATFGRDAGWWWSLAVWPATSWMDCDRRQAPRVCWNSTRARGASPRRYPTDCPATASRMSLGFRSGPSSDTFASPRTPRRRPSMTSRAVCRSSAATHATRWMELLRPDTWPRWHRRSAVSGPSFARVHSSESCSPGHTTWTGRIYECPATGPNGRHGLRPRWPRLPALIRESRRVRPRVGVHPEGSTC